MKSAVAVLGAGIVGVSCALELQRRGHDVTIFDRMAPGRETSYGNAGVIARSSLMPFNNPGLWSSLPKLLKNESASFRYDPLFLARNLHWALGFLSHARAGSFQETTAALDALIRLSTKEHQRLLLEAGAAHRLRANGWLFLYRSEQGFAGSQLSRATFDKFGISTQALDAHELSELEPDLKPLFPRALWIKDTFSVDNPGRVVEAYASLFVSRGGRIKQTLIGGIGRSGTNDG
jgi:D-amino-acid dehydrogenase